MSLRLKILNLFRWLREYIVAWGLLSFIYSLTVTAILQPLLENALKHEVPFKPLWAITCTLLLIPGILEDLPLGVIRLPMRAGKLANGSLIFLYLRHEMRRGSTWFTVFLTVLCAGFLPAKREALWILVAQLPIQRALYSVHKWRALALAFKPADGARDLLRSILVSQFVQLTVAWFALGVTGFFSFDKWILIGPACLGAMISGSVVAMEGDSGRPWLVNFFSLAAATVGGFLCLISPWFLLLAVYLGHTCINLAAGRLHSVEHLDEDTVIS